VLQHRGMWLQVSRYAKGCALDHITHYKPKMVPNTAKVTANVCRTSVLMAAKGSKDGLLCRIVKLCKLKSKACGVTTDENLWRDWAKKNKGKRDFFAKYPSFPYKKKYSKKWPRCTNVQCLDSRTMEEFQALCNKFQGCTGFTFPSGLGKTDKGSGCLKRCGRKEFGGKGKGKHDYWQKVDKSMPKRKTPAQKQIKPTINRVVRQCANDPKVARAKKPVDEAAKCAKLLCKKALADMGLADKAVEKGVKQCVEAVKKRVAPAGKRGLVANQQQTQSKDGKNRVRKRSGAGKWAKHGCKVTQQWANAHIAWCPWGNWGNWGGKKGKDLKAGDGHGQELLISHTERTRHRSVGLEEKAITDEEKGDGEARR